MMKHTLGRALRPVVSRLKLRRAILWGGFGLTVGSIAAAVEGIAAFLWPIEHALLYGLVLLWIGGTIGLLLGWLWPVSVKQAASGADNCGLFARIQTAMEGEVLPETPMGLLQKEDALNALTQLEISTALPLGMHKGAMALTAVFMSAAVVMAFLPNPQHTTLQAQKTFQQEMKKQAELVEKGIKEMETAKDPAAQETRRLLQELAKEMREAREPRTALEAVDQTTQKLEKLREKQRDDFRQALADAGLEDLANAMEEGTAEAIQKAMEKQDAASLAESLTKMAESEGAASEMLQSAAKAVTAGNMSQASQVMAGAMAASSGSLSQGTTLTQMAQFATARAGQSLGSPSNPSAMQAVAALGSQGQQGQQGGSGASAGQGQNAGTGAGMGSTNADAGYTGTSAVSGQSGGREPSGKMGIYEAIYDPTRLGGTGEITQERGRIGEGDISEATIMGEGTNLGDVVPYGDIALEYQDAAVQTVQNANLPHYVQKWVESYFQSLVE